MYSSVAISEPEIDRKASALTEQCNATFEGFGRLGELAEDMRVLSLNAELAAGRAGDKGAAVRVLTQYTRELVFRLNSADEDITRLMGKLSGDDSEMSDGRCLDRISNIVECAMGLSDAAKDVAGVSSQASSISTNIAIEAALSGQHEAEFSQVAVAMQDYVDQLRGMTDSAARTIHSAVLDGRVLYEQASAIAIDNHPDVT